MGKERKPSEYTPVQDEFAPVPGARTFAINGPSQTKPFFRETTPAGIPQPPATVAPLPPSQFQKDQLETNKARWKKQKEPAAPAATPAPAPTASAPAVPVPGRAAAPERARPSLPPLLTNQGEGGPRIATPAEGGGFREAGPDPNLRSIVDRVPTRKQYLEQNFGVRPSLPVTTGAAAPAAGERSPLPAGPRERWDFGGIPAPYEQGQAPGDQGFSDRLTDIWGGNPPQRGAMSGAGAAGNPFQMIDRMDFGRVASDMLGRIGRDQQGFSGIGGQGGGRSIGASLVSTSNPTGHFGPRARSEAEDRRSRYAIDQATARSIFEHVSPSADMAMKESGANYRNSADAGVNMERERMQQEGFDRRQGITEQNLNAREQRRQETSYGVADRSLAGQIFSTDQRTQAAAEAVAHKFRDVPESLQKEIFLSATDENGQYDPERHAQILQSVSENSAGGNRKQEGQRWVARNKKTGAMQPGVLYPDGKFVPDKR